MRNLKKILALVLALMMVLSVMVFASAANYDDYSDKDQVSPEYAEAVEVLTGMDIFWGSENSFYPKSNVTRAEVATLLYRIMTGDITGSQVGIYKDYGMFDDVSEDNWFAGYVNYAANGELVVGVGDNKYNPKGNVTGYEWITMLLRAIGYDANGEISGSTWKITAASLAKQAGILGSFNEATLNSALTREQVAYLLFNAIQARKVNYTNAFGYRPSSLGYTIAWDMFRLAKTGTISIDAWGRPGYVWYGESSSTATPNTANYSSTADTLYATMEEAPVKTYNTAVTECDVATDVGIRTTKTYTTYTNGVENDGSKTIRATATTATIGEQGRLTEVYDDVIVYIDTLFAFVTDVNETTYDNAGHVRRYATMDLGVYVADNRAQEITLTNYEGDWDYTEGTALLINAVTVDEDDHAAILEGDDQHVEIVEEATSFVGSQSNRGHNAGQHIVDGDTYDDAFCLHLDTAGLDTTRHNWWLDQYGNLIAITDISRNSYVVLKDLIWIQGRPGYAEATLINMDGTEYTAEVATIDGDSNYDEDDTTGFGWNSDNFVPELEDAANIGFWGNSANVSTDSRYNGLYEGYALYYVTTNDDGSVNLDGYDDNGTPGNFSDNTYWVDYEDNATINTTTTAILDSTGNVVVHLDNSTQFIVNNGDGTYSTYNRNNLPEFIEDSVEVFYDGVATNANTRIANCVYIKSYTLEQDIGKHLFVTNDNWWDHELSNGATEYELRGSYVDGESRVVYTTNENIKDYLTANVGKLFHVTIDARTGYITAVTLVNERTDEGSPNDQCSPGGLLCDYLSYEDENDIVIGNGAVVFDRESYDYDEATLVVSENVEQVDSVEEAVEEGLGIWVTYNDTEYNQGVTYYIGEKLNTSVALNVTADDGTVEKDDNYATNNTWNYTSDEDDIADVLTYTVADENAVVVMPSGTANTGRTSYTDNINNSNPGRSVTVWNEAGTKSAPYTISLTWVTSNKAIDNLDKVELNGEEVDTANGYKTLAEAIENATEMNLPAAGTYTELKVRVYTTLCSDGWNYTAGDVKWASTKTAAQDLELTPQGNPANCDADGAPVTLSGADAGTYVVIALEDYGDVAYFAYYMTESA